MQNSSNLLQLVRWIFSLTFKLSPKLITLATLSTVIIATLDLLQVYVFANILGQVVKLATQESPDLRQVIQLLFFRFLIITVRRILRFVEEYTHSAAYEILDPLLDKALAQKIHDLKIQSLEDPEIQNKIQRAKDGLGSVLNFLWRSLVILESITRLLIAIAGVITTYPLLLLINLAVRIPMFFNDKYFRKKIWQLRRDTTEDRRKSYQSYHTITDSSSLQEVFLTDSFKNFLNRYLKVITSLAKELNSTRASWFSRSHAILYLAEMYELFVYAFVIFQIVNKKLETSTGLVITRLVETIDDSMGTLFRSINELQQLSIRIQDTYTLFQQQPAFPDGQKNFPILSRGPSISIQNLSFSYPNSSKYIFNNFNLQIKSGEKIAIVGENGAGKTTLVKLLCRMYQAKEGKITIDNYDLAEVNSSSYYKNLGVLFQDYNTYPHLTVSQNISLGLPNQKPNQAKVKKAAIHANAHDFIESLPNKYDQLVSERYKGGQRLSTGQWQKIAIARFFYRDSPLVIFDEPTAAIDAVAESRIFNRIYNFFKNKTVIIISHRFSTVRSADRIIVLDKGRIVEQGSHRELLAQNGKYAYSFNLQAKGYEK